KLLITIILGLCVISNINAQELEIKQLSVVQNLSALEGEEVGDSSICVEMLEEGSPSIQSHNRSTKFMSLSTKVETTYVQVVRSNGYTFHVADYYDGTRVISCLDGSLKGLQEMYFNGVLQAWTNAVLWSNGYFIHYYQHGEVISYPNKQIVKIY
ncbi:hypothetical protein N9Y92_00810, partial [Chlamydiales bacterium]|nr:hypothetical protein [Chlamydiales bacterium]